MKKSMVFLLCVVSALVSLIYGMNEKYNDTLKLNSIDKQGQYYEIYVDESSVTNEAFLGELSRISSKYNSSIIRTEIIDENGRSVTYKAGIFTKEYTNSLNKYLSSGNTIRDDADILSTFQTGDNHQVGTIHDLFNDDPIIVTTLNSYLKNANKSVSGTYTICCSYNDIDAIVGELSIFLNQDSSSLMTSNYTQTFAKGPVEIIMMACIILLMIYTLMCLFYPTSQIKKIGVYKLLGFKGFDIWKKLNLSNLMVFSGVTVLSMIVQKLLIPSLDVPYLIKLLALQGVVLLISTLLSAFMMLVVRKYTLNSILKGFFHVRASLIVGYALKFVTFVSLVFVVPYMTTCVESFVRQISAKNAYEQSSNMMTLTSYEYIGDEFQQVLNGNSEVYDKFYSMFHELEKTANAQYFYFTGMDWDYLSQMDSLVPASRSIEKDEFYPVIYTNENGLNQYKNWFDSPVHSYFTTNHVVILVPDMYQNDSRMDYVYRLIPNSLSDINMKLDIKYYRTNNKSVFTQSGQMIDKGKVFVQNPIFVCLNSDYIEKEAMFFTSDALTNPIRIEKSAANDQAIITAINNAGLQNNKLEFDSILNTGFKEYLKTIQLGLAITGIGLLLIVIVDVLASYYILLILLVTRNKEIFVKKILGHSLIERYKNELFFFVVLYIMCILELILTGQSLVSLVIMISLILIDIVIMYLMIRLKENKSINLILKGEE